MDQQKPKNCEIEKHNVSGLEKGILNLETGQFLPGSHSMFDSAQTWLLDEVIGIQSRNTAIAKRGDLRRFFEWFLDMNGHLDIHDWLPRDTASFLDSLERDGRSAATVNRHLATLRRWARWCIENGPSPFHGPIPTKGIKERATQEPDSKRLTNKEINRIFKAAERLVVTDNRKNSRPRRNAAILAVAYYTGLRASEIASLNLAQYDEPHFKNVIRKGRARTSRVYVPKKCRAYILDYFENERAGDAAAGETLERLFLPSGGGSQLGRLTVWRVFKRLSKEASAHLVGELKIHPHQMRHTFGYEVRQRTGSDTETAALLGHAGLKYVGRYVRATDEERAVVLDDL